VSVDTVALRRATPVDAQHVARFAAMPYATPQHRKSVRITWDPEPESVFVITAYDLEPKALKALRRRRRRKK
jgi:hypothetical protein